MRGSPDSPAPKAYTYTAPKDLKSYDAAFLGKVGKIQILDEYEGKVA